MIVTSGSVTSGKAVFMQTKNETAMNVKLEVNVLPLCNNGQIGSIMFPNDILLKKTPSVQRYIFHV